MDREQASPWWLRIGREPREVSERCPDAPCEPTPEPYDAYCREHSALLVFQDRARRQWGLNLLRAGAVGSFTMTALLSNRFPVFAAAVVAALLVVAVPLRGYPVGRRVALWSSVLAALTFTVVDVVAVPTEHGRWLTTIGVIGATVVWLAYAYSAAQHLRRHADPSAFAPLAQAAIAGSCILGVTFAALGAALRPLAVHVSVPAADTRAWLFVAAVTLLTGGPLVIAAAAGFFRSGETVNRTVTALLTAPQPVSAFVPRRPPNSARPVGATGLALVLWAGDLTARRVRWAVLRLADRVAHACRHTVVACLRGLVVIANFVDQWLIRAARRVAHAVRHAVGLLGESIALVVAVITRFALTFGLPLAAVTASVAALRLGSIEVLRYLTLGGLQHAGLAAGMAAVAVGLLFATWMLLSGTPLRPAWSSMAHSIGCALPNALLLFVAGAWANGIPGSLGYGPIRIGPLTLGSTAVLIALTLLAWRFGSATPSTSGGDDGIVTAGPLQPETGPTVEITIPEAEGIALADATAVHHAAPPRERI